MEVKIEQWCVWHFFGSVSVVMFGHDSLLLSREKIVVATCYSIHDVQLFTVLTCSWFLCFSGVCLCSLIPQGTGISSSLYPLHGEVRYLWGRWAFVVVSSSLGLMSVLWLQQNYKGCFVFGFNLFSLPTYVGCSPLLLWHAGIPHLPLDIGQGQDLGALQGASWVSFCWFWQ